MSKVKDKGYSTEDPTCLLHFCEEERTAALNSKLCLIQESNYMTICSNFWSNFLFNFINILIFFRLFFLLFVIFW